MGGNEHRQEGNNPESGVCHLEIQTGGDETGEFGRPMRGATPRAVGRGNIEVSSRKNIRRNESDNRR